MASVAMTSRHTYSRARQGIIGNGHDDINQNNDGEASDAQQEEHDGTEKDKAIAEQIGTYCKSLELEREHGDFGHKQQAADKNSDDERKHEP